MPPPSSERLFAGPADSAACREMIRTGSRSFYTASLFLPDVVRGAAYALYGFCRLSDDAVDVEGGEAQAIGRLARRLDRIYGGDPEPQPVDRAFADAVAAFAIPRALMDALLEGLAWDVEGRRYETLSEVFDYAARVAGAVGAMMASLMGARSPALLARACDLGVAMQLTNIARDVGEDARAGRLYLPRSWLRDAGLDPDEWLRAPTFNPTIRMAVARLLGEAEALYRRADAGIARLDPSFRPAIFAARGLYADIGHKLAADGFDSVARRTVVSPWRKAQRVVEALAAAGRPAVASAEGPPSPETAFLVDAVTSAAPTMAGNAARGVKQDVVWIIDLFASLESRSRTSVPVKA